MAHGAGLQQAVEGGDGQIGRGGPAEHVALKSEDVARRHAKIGHGEPCLT